MDYRDEIIERLPSKGVALSDNVLAKISFLRTSDSTLKEEEKTYHFLHLTFQEFFAARHFVRQWISEKPLFCFTISGNHGKTQPVIQPRNFLQKEKYNARYNIFWRFVTGLFNLVRTKNICFSSSECWTVNHVIYLDLHINGSSCIASVNCLQNPV